MTIRPATGGDLAHVQACAKAAYALYVARIGKAPAPMVADFQAQIAAGQVYVAEADGEVAGFVVLYPRRDHLHVENVAVFPARQGLGLGGALLAFAEQEARRRRLAAVELYTNAKMTENLALYPRLGYREIDRREEAGFSRVFYRKEIGSP
ncbi:MAG: GNAT family N-acetyltransferase [Kiloniellales bacterium]|nr:GNAT family N-acetyltransferase [Kiloniellales bacterium]